MNLLRPERRRDAPEGYADTLAAAREIHGWPSLRRAKLLAGIGSMLRNEAEALAAGGDRDLAKRLTECATTLGNASPTVDRHETDNEMWNDAETVRRLSAMNYDALGKFLGALALGARAEGWRESRALHLAAGQMLSAGKIVRANAERKKSGRQGFVSQLQRLVATL